jgi:hypothetical protein
VDVGVPSVRAFARVCSLRSVAVLLSTLLVFPVGSAWGDVASQRLPVSATVLPHARLVGAGTEPRVAVTPADVERGYVDVQHHYQLRTNVPDRVAIQIHPRVGLAAAVDVAGFDAAVRLVDTSLEVSAPARRELDVSFRLWLSPHVAPGEYPLPLQMAAILL